MIKVPATRAGVPAVRQLISEGINVNITLLFGVPRYREIIEAYLEGLESLASQGKPLDRIASVASFFLSRIDTLVDPMLEWIKSEGGNHAQIASELYGMVAIDSAQVAYDLYQKVFYGERFNRLVQMGAHTQRLLWASTSTKNPAFSDIKYVEALIAPETINTLPVETLQAYRAHGRPLPRLSEPNNSCQARERLNEIGIDLDAITQQLEDEGVQKFEKSYDQLIGALQEKQKSASVPISAR
jgi:transaldolase